MGCFIVNHGRCPPIVIPDSCGFATCGILGESMMKQVVKTAFSLYSGLVVLCKT